MNMDKMAKDMLDTIGRYGAIIHKYQHEIVPKLNEQVEQLKAENASLRARLDKAELPCKVGDTVYLIHDYDEEIYCLEVTRITIFPYGRIKFELNYSGAILLDEFGKTVFLTEAEAQAKLEEMKGGSE